MTDNRRVGIEGKFRTRKVSAARKALLYEQQSKADWKEVNETLAFLERVPNMDYGTLQLEVNARGGPPYLNSA
jgi:hypothetical protein